MISGHLENRMLLHIIPKNYLQLLARHEKVLFTQQSAQLVTAEVQSLFDEMTV
jgi:hypothetical protein